MAYMQEQLVCGSYGTCRGGKVSELRSVVPRNLSSSNIYTVLLEFLNC